MNTIVQHATLADMIAANLDPETNGHGRALTDYTLRVVVHPTDGAVELVVHPTGFDFKAQSFGVQGNGLLTPEQLKSWREAQAITREEEMRAAQARNAAGVVDAPVTTGTGEQVAAPTMGGSQ